VNILAVDTALGACSAALLADGRILARDHCEMQRGHAEALAPMVESVMREAELNFSALDKIAVTTGPGTFTGQRVGLAFARALGLALKRPVIGVTTLDAMAEEALAKAANPVWAIAAADAKRGEVYLGGRAASGETLFAPELIQLDAVAARIAAFVSSCGRSLVIAGTAAEAVLPLLQRAGLVPSDGGVRQPNAVFVAKLAAGVTGGSPPKPLYLRAPDAKLPGGRS
jgi:tRNA threonylcarbamoyladenosine biosynthesis protein TsaB